MIAAILKSRSSRQAVHCLTKIKVIIGIGVNNIYTYNLRIIMSYNLQHEPLSYKITNKHRETSTLQHLHRLAMCCSKIQLNVTSGKLIARN